MYTSEIRETDTEGKPVTPSPALLERVRATDDALRERIGSGFELDYVGRWAFPEPEKALLTFLVRATSEETYAVSMPFELRTSDDFVGRVIDKVLVQAQKAIGTRVERRMHDLLVSTAAE